MFHFLEVICSNRHVNKYPTTLHAPYQMSTLASTSLYIGSFAVTEKASWNSAMFDSGPLHRNSFGPCGSIVRSCRALSFVMFWRQHCAHERKKR